MKERIIDGMNRMGVMLPEESALELCLYAKTLQEWNEKINLTKIIDDEGIITKHFLDSATTLLTNKLGKKVIDVGCGAGFPGLVLKICAPAIELTLLDSLNKRINFLDDVCQKLSIKNVSLVHSRAEDGGRNKEYREKYDTAVSRAVANLKLLSELCLPYVRVGGYFLALKGPGAESEIEEARRAISILGGELESVFSVDIPFTDLNHKIVIIKKVRSTPVRFPRKPSYISKCDIESCYKKS